MTDYYTTPAQEIFDDIKQNSIKIRKTYDDTYWYATEKISIVESIENNKDNWLYIVAMFDSNNQSKLLNLVNQETKDYLLQFI